MKKINVLLFVVIFTNACSQSSTERSDNPQGDSKLFDIKLTNLIQTILDSPAVIQFSKSDLLREEYGKIYIFFPEGVPKPTALIYQSGFALEGVDAKLPDNTPCYVFEKIDFEGNTAYVSMHVDVTNFFCEGNLNYVNEKWIPDKNFKIGYK